MKTGRPRRGVRSMEARRRARAERFRRPLQPGHRVRRGRTAGRGAAVPRALRPRGPGGAVRPDIARVRKMLGQLRLDHRRMRRTSSCSGIVALVELGHCVDRRVLAYARRTSPADGPVILISIDTLRADHLPAYGYTQGAHAEHRRAGGDRRAVRARLLARAADAAGAHERSCRASCRSSTACATTSASPSRPGNGSCSSALHDRGLADRRLRLRLRAAPGDRASTRASTPSTASCRRVRRAVDRPGAARRRADARGRRKVARRARDRRSRSSCSSISTSRTSRMRRRSASRSIEPYDGEIAYADEIVGRLLDRLRAHRVYDRVDDRAARRTTAKGSAITASRSTACSSTSETTHVPLIDEAAGPATSARRVAAPVQHIDLVPTILDLVGAPMPPGLHGRSLKPLLDGTGTLRRHRHLRRGALLALPLRLERAVRADRFALSVDPRAARRVVRPRTRSAGIRVDCRRAAAGAAGDAHRARDADRARVDRARRRRSSTRIGSGSPRSATSAAATSTSLSLPGDSLARSERQGPGAREIPARLGSRRRPEIRRGDGALSRGAARRSRDDATSGCSSPRSRCARA